MNSISVVIVDDHEVVRSGLASLIQTWFPLRVIGQFASGEALLNDTAIIAEADLVLIDNLLLGISGEETYKQLQETGEEFNNVESSSGMADSHFNIPAKAF